MADAEIGRFPSGKSPSELQWPHARQPSIPRELRHRWQCCARACATGPSIWCVRILGRPTWFGHCEILLPSVITLLNASHGLGITNQEHASETYQAISIGSMSSVHQIFYCCYGPNLACSPWRVTRAILLAGVGVHHVIGSGDSWV